MSYNGDDDDDGGDGAAFNHLRASRHIYSFVQPAMGVYYIHHRI